MQPEYIIQLRQQLEAIKEFERKNAPTKARILAFWGELLAGVLFLGLSVLRRSEEIELAAQLTYYLGGIALLSQGLYLLIRVKLDKRMKLILEAMLTINDSPKP